MIVAVLMMLFVITEYSWADIFVKPTQQTSLEVALSKDSRNFYYRSGLNYNPSDSKDVSAYEFKKERISLGCSRYDFHTSLENFINKEEFPDRIQLGMLMERLSSTGLAIWQYSSPTMADLYKHLDTTGRVQLGTRYRQCDNLEKSMDDPIIKLRQQAIIDCIKHYGSEGVQKDIEAAFKECFDNPRAPYISLKDPGDGRLGVFDLVDITEKVLIRVKGDHEDTNMVEEILPHLMVSHHTVTMKAPRQTSRSLIVSYRKDFSDRLSRIVKDFYDAKELDADELSALSVFGVPLTEGQVRNIALLDSMASDLTINKIASELAYLKTMDQYFNASRMLDLVMSHPAIEAGYKTLLKSSVDYVKNEMSMLKDEKVRLEEYYVAMQSVLKEADLQRVSILDAIQRESIKKQEGGFLKLNL